MIMNVKDSVIGRSILIQKGKIKHELKENFAILNPTINNIGDFNRKRTVTVCAFFLDRIKGSLQK
jgi:hypothetical protein